MPIVQHALSQLVYFSGSVATVLMGSHALFHTYLRNHVMDTYRLKSEDGNSFERVGKELLELISDAVAELKISLENKLKYEFVLVRDSSMVSWGNLKNAGAIIGIPSHFRLHGRDEMDNLKLHKRLDQQDQDQLLDTYVLSSGAKKFAVTRECYLGHNYCVFLRGGTFIGGFVVYNGILKSFRKLGWIRTMPALFSCAVFALAATVYFVASVQNEIRNFYLLNSVRRVCKHRDLDLLSGGLEFYEKEKLRNQLLHKKGSHRFTSSGEHLTFFGLQDTRWQDELEHVRTALSRLSKRKKIKRPDPITKNDVSSALMGKDFAVSKENEII